MPLKRSKQTPSTTKSGGINKRKAKPSASSAIASTMPPAEPANSEGPIYFWKPHQAHGYLGQWYESEWTTPEGDTYATAEMWMMVGKARLFGDEEIAQQMLLTKNPKTHKALGRKVRNFDEKIWNANKRRIVEEGNYFKFTVSKEADRLREMLMATGERELVEASPLDRVWGIGFGERNAEGNRGRWGANLLGKAVMDVRGRLREEGKEKE